ncbi:MAG: glutamine--fructose-6-phosphate transaminase (isomerizing) [Zetaproteobacteria bacterium CG_4_9_14_3_um_filter_49_83]|nr:MAG: glutamine--fructose-6-phosphate aminotransferase [Zetaproteobacteria bacterium CG1_02_49_23]PIQ30447.1 MAG: glutamine--fructose-6-phosphate transaminase (isomerizing) [Zetaproteobacteria bacterium CG17_big_fil_post_rev_8_21_14_2_50_50_13]PIV29303.1 MAG: glutamine--fructose-6-phosphate transaminase (isomerizing) [Zetaproteobacteria bacterium CG02_land_8_20_14_3_00_50_9]PIY56285.1 MAG: glutamine--fructose-6-phosphate transaminase (isomerizing) [Zetaproteobacteria bacterium CG_4_10_14_0_8_u
MCGIIGAIAQRNVVPILIEGLKALEYRGYDSAGIAIIEKGEVRRVRAKGKLVALEEELAKGSCESPMGIGHTRWATHGVPSVNNAHPHACGDFVLVHNGIIENHQLLKRDQSQHHFESETDSEVIVHLLNDLSGQCDGDLFDLVQKGIQKLQGSYALAVMRTTESDSVVVARHGSPLVIGLGVGENFIASDVLALLPVTSRFIYLEDGDVARISTHSIEIVNAEGQKVDREVKESTLEVGCTTRGEYRHFMLKEIFEQPVVIGEALEGRLSNIKVLDPMLLGASGTKIIELTKRVQIVACGTSYHAGLTAKYWFEQWARIPCEVDIASELRYRKPVVSDGTLLVVISQSGETADTLAVLNEAKSMGYVHSMAICNVPESSMVRGADVSLLTRAGPEVGVASTKAFTTQLVVLAMLAVSLGRRFELTSDFEENVVNQLKQLPSAVSQVLALDGRISILAQTLVHKHHALFLGRGPGYPVAMEAALKLKEISYIHAEAYAAGELKHGPLALVDEDMPVIAVMPDDDLLDKVQSNLSEVRARGGRLLVLTDHDHLEEDEYTTVLNIGTVPKLMRPVVFSVALQLLAYHVAVLRGTDVDRPRNLAKSVTVE